jgi:hypothetical protein
MAIELLKVVYQVHMLRRDEHGAIVDEIATQQPLVLYPHQLATLPAAVDMVLAQAEDHVVQPVDPDGETKRR